MQGIFDKVNAALFGRARDYSDEEKNDLDQMIVDVIKGEFKNAEIPIITNMVSGILILRLSCRWE